MDPAPTAPRPRLIARPNAWQLTGVVFLTSACLMALELTIQRTIAPYVGASLYVWTIVIGVILAGTSLGNYLGGRLADRRASSHLLGAVLALGGITALALLAVDVLAYFRVLEDVQPRLLWLIIGLALFVLGLCLAPAIALGAVGPVAVKLAVRDLARTGRVVGRIYAANAIGSIAGTFAAGFLLISWVGTHVVIWSAGALLIALGLFYLLRDRWPWLVLSGLVLVAGTVVAGREGWLRGTCTRETDYYCVIVEDDEINGLPVRKLILDRLIHSYSSLEDPTALIYGYERSYAGAAAYQAARVDEMRALFVGGGGYTFPRYMEAVYPESEVVVIEIDPGVTDIAYEQLGLSADSRIVTYNEDARTFLERAPAERYHLIYGDAFNDYAVPYHLTTREFNERVRAWLTDDGLYVVNIIDGPSGRFLRAYVHTLRQTFPHVNPAFSVSGWRSAGRMTIVILAGNQPLDAQALRDTAPSLADLIVPPDKVDAILAEGRTVTLTDRYAPVDHLLLPVFLDQLR